MNAPQVSHGCNSDGAGAPQPTQVSAVSSFSRPHAVQVHGKGALDARTAPAAMAVMGLTAFKISLSTNIARRRSTTPGIRDDPPATTTWLMSVAASEASDSASAT